MKKTFLILTICASLQAYALDLDNFVDKVWSNVIGKLDAKFDNLFSQGISIMEQCYPEVNTDINVHYDICSLAGKLDNLKFNACSLIGGSGNLQVGISGVKRLCESKLKQFSDYASKASIDYIEYAVLDEPNADNTKAILPSGETMQAYLKRHDINSILQSKDSLMASYIKDGNLDALSVFMDYGKTSGAKLNTDSIKIEDIKAPANLNAYQKDLSANIQNLREIYKEATPTAVANLTRSKIQQVEPEEAAAIAKQNTKELKKHFEIAKSTEIGLALSNSDYKKIPIPTQEYVEANRKDIQPDIIKQIRKQQAYETAIIMQIEEKYQRKYELAKLLSDKEVILAQEFDREEAQQEIEQLVANVR